MPTAKQETLKAIQRLPDGADTEEMIYRLYVLENIRRGQEDAAEGKTESAQGVLKDIQSWRSGRGMPNRNFATSMTTSLKTRHCMPDRPVKSW